jgi:hypothetical protein
VAAHEKLSEDQFPVLYHGSHRPEDVESIRSEGMRSVPEHVLSPARWPTLTTSRGQAERYGKHVVEVHLPQQVAHTHLWPAQHHTAYGYDAQAYAVRKPIPREHIR